MKLLLLLLSFAVVFEACNYDVTDLILATVFKVFFGLFD